MNQKKKQSFKSLFKGMIWWHPILLILLLSMLGVFASRFVDSDKVDQAGIISSVLAESREEEGAVLSLQEAGETLLRESPDQSVSEEALGEEAFSNEDTLFSQEGTYIGSGPFEEIKENGNYTSKEEVAFYIHTYGHLPSNYITKSQAMEQGWNPDRGNLGDILPGMSIGGSTFGNYEGKLPRAEGRKYFECDIDYNSGYRNAKRIVYSNDGLIFYTEDHYDTFEQLY